MKIAEKEIIKSINKKFNVELIESHSPYMRYDAENNNYIVEIKKRHKYYEDTVIEFEKYCWNKEYSKLKNKEFLYVVQYLQIIYIFNITTLDKEQYNYSWHWRGMPKQTEFNQTEDIDKFIGYINIKESVVEFSDDKFHHNRTTSTTP